MKIAGWNANLDEIGVEEEKVSTPLLEKFRAATPEYPLYATFMPEGRIEEIREVVEKGPWLLVDIRNKREAEDGVEVIICMGSVEKTKRSEEEIILGKLAGEEEPREITHLFASVFIRRRKEVSIRRIWYA